MYTITISSFSEQKMNNEFKNLVKDVVSYIKCDSPLFFEERYSISFKPKKNTVPQKIAKPSPIAPVLKKPVEIISKPKVSEEKPKEILPKEEKSKVKPAKEKKSLLDKPLEAPVKFEHFESIKRLIIEIDPHFALAKEILDDTKAKKIASKWKYKLNAYPVVILTSLKEGDELDFLKSLAKAIEIYFFETKVVLIDTIEKDNQWEEFLKSENIRLLIAVDDQLWSFKNLMTHFKEIPNKSLKTLMDKPLFLIPNIKLYFQNFLLKKSLWKALCQTISNL